MTHGRIETTPEQQLAELRQAYARYSTLAERLHEDDAVDAKVREARERNARRIALAYEKTIASTAARMESMHRTHAEGAGFTRLAKGLSVMLAGAVIVCGVLIIYLRPDIGRTLMALIPAQQESTKAPAAAPTSVTTSVARNAPATPPPAAMPAAVEPAPVVPMPRPAQAEDQAAIKLAAKPVAKPVIAPPNERVANAAPQKDEKRDAKTLPGTAAPARPPAVTAAPVKTETAKADIVKADTVKVAGPPAPAKPAQLAAAPAPQTPAPAPQAPAPQATVEPLSPPRDVAALPSPPQAAQDPQSKVQVIETPAAPASAPAAPQASSKLVAVMRTHVRPPYPLDAKRAGEQGTTRMEVSISPQGAITDCKVTDTSGSNRLDSTACSFVRRYWRWEPRDVPGTTKISVIWNLINGN